MSRLRTVAGTLALFAIPAAAALLGPAVFWDQGCIEGEATTFIRQYRADRPVLQKVFDPHANDIGTYQARELSYLIDLADAYAYAPLATLFGQGFSIPLSSLAASLLFVLVFAAGARRVATRVDRVTASLLLLCFVTSFGFVSTMGVYYRSAKPVLATVAIAWVFLVLHVQQQRTTLSGAASRTRVAAPAALTFTLATIAGLLDRQGLFLIVAAAALLILHYRRTKALRDLCLASAGAALAVELYNHVAGPLIVHALNGYWPDFSYQRIPPRELLRLPNHLLRAIALLTQNTALLLGGSWSIATAVLLLLAVVGHRYIPWRTDAGRWAQIVAYARHGAHGSLLRYGALVLSAQVVMFALMIARHGYVYRWIDHRFWYYPITYLGLAVVGLLLILNATLPLLTARQGTAVRALLLVMIASNVLSLESYRRTMVSGPWFGHVYAQCELLKTSLRSGNPAPGLAPGYRALFDERVLRMSHRP